MYSINLIKQVLTSAKTIAIIGHQNPDADSLASAVALKKGLEQIKDVIGEKTIRLFSENIEYGDLYNPIIKGEEFNIFETETYDLAISVDSPNSKRMGAYENVFNNATSTINLDHHENNENFATLNLIYKCSSTCELVFVLLKALNIVATVEMLKMLYAGIITDTVNLTQGAIKVSSYKIVAEIAQRVGDVSALDAIKDHYLKSNTKSNIKLLEKALNSMRFYLEDRVAIMKITKEDQEDAEAQQSDTLGIVNHAINVKGVYIAILFIKKENGNYYVSLRGKNGVDVSEIAVALGGGGHDTVSAFECSSKLAELKPELLRLCEKALEGASEDEDGSDLFGE